MATATGILSDDACKDMVTLETTTPGLMFNGKVRLTQSAHVPSNADVLATYTAIESTFAGYAAALLTGWVVSVAAHIASSAASTVTFTLTAGTQSVYGGFIADNGGTKLLAGWSDPNAPTAMSLTANTYQVTVTLSIKDQAT